MEITIRALLHARVTLEVRADRQAAEPAACLHDGWEIDSGRIISVECDDSVEQILDTYAADIAEQLEAQWNERNFD